ncbi:polysaccharide biosynthesis tyrosine autokinase [Propionimicrobium sp. PCR01-08-3]|uniref:polysaccharide biosynthesis tyrosine autokinase n=1 Tax=Propionimicrobium sp. PCR01-08-3 TaxID=3052086 RepID=UPI00255C5BE4|nr:polysaccharide biosynthesis tyrosine autokinase [Propionimicrobium sp. PCR01-08-3]WIY83004.1 polysaccharide biosynthesis tyrosine autokinase [Propionimicrobium sp. PCR01-08-3]
MELTDYLRILRKYWRSITAITLVGVLVTAVFSMLTKPTYTSNTSIFISVSSVSTVGDLNSGSTYAESQVQSFAKVAKTDIVLQPVIDELGLQTTPTSLADDLTVTAPTKTATLDMAVVGDTPESAAQIATAIGKQLVATIDALTPPGADGTKPVVATIIRPAQIPTSPTTPKTMQNIALGLLLGLLIGAGQAILRDMLNQSIRGDRDIERVTDVPVIGQVPNDDNAAAYPLILNSDPHSARAEAYRSLRTNLQFLGLDKGKRAVVVTSSVPGEGKTTTAINVASTIAAAGERVLVIDADLRRPAVAKYLHAEPSVGLTTVLIGEAELGEVIQPTSDSLMDVLASGPVPPNPAELLGLPHMQQLIENASKRYDTVIVDAPPLLPVTDATVLSRIADGTLVVVGAGVAKRPELDAALEKLDMVDARILGLLLTRVNQRDSSTYTYEYTYGPDSPKAGQTKIKTRTKNPGGTYSSGAEHKTGRRAEREAQPVQ